MQDGEGCLNSGPGRMAEGWTTGDCPCPPPPTPLPSPQPPSNCPPLLTRSGVLELEVLVLKLVPIDALPSGAVAASEVPSLAHEARDHSVEAGALVPKPLLPSAQGTEVLCSVGRSVGSLQTAAMCTAVCQVDWSGCGECHTHCAPARVVGRLSLASVGGLHSALDGLGPQPRKPGKASQPCWKGGNAPLCTSCCSHTITGRIGLKSRVKLESPRYVGASLLLQMLRDSCSAHVR